MCDVGKVSLWLLNRGRSSELKFHKIYEAVLHNSYSSRPKIMDSATKTAESLRIQIAATEEQLKKLRDQLSEVESQNAEASSQELEQPGPVTHGKWPLTSEEYKRYGRQMIVPNIGIQGFILLTYLYGCI